jgi:hypothetical protein
VLPSIGEPECANELLVDNPYSTAVPLNRIWISLEPQAEAALRSLPFRTQRVAGARCSRTIDVDETYGRRKALSENDEAQLKPCAVSSKRRDVLDGSAGREVRVDSGVDDSGAARVWRREAIGAIPTRTLASRRCREPDATVERHAGRQALRSAEF